MERPLPSSGVTERMATRNSSSSVACGKNGFGRGRILPGRRSLGLFCLWLFLFVCVCSFRLSGFWGQAWQKNFEGKAPGLGLSGTMRSMAARKKARDPFFVSLFPGSCLSSCRKPGKWLVGEAFVLCHDHLQKPPRGGFGNYFLLSAGFSVAGGAVFPDCPQGLVRPLWLIRWRGR